MTDDCSRPFMRLPANWPAEGNRTWRVLVGAIVLASGLVVGGVVASEGPHLATDTQDDGDGTLVVIESSSNDTAHYRFSVDGTVEPANRQGSTVEADEGKDDRFVEGTVNGTDTDAYRVDGSITGLVLSGNVTLSRDGQEVTPANLSDDWSVAFENCSTVSVSGDYETGYAFSTVIFPVETSDGTFVGFEEAMVNEELAIENETASLQAGTTLPEDVSNVTALRSVFLYEQQVAGNVEPLLVESEVTVLLGQPAVRVENPAHDACQSQIMDRLENETSGNTTTG